MGKMKIGEFRERNLLIDNNGAVLDENGNEYRNEDGENMYLDVSDSVKRKILKKQADNGFEPESSY